MRSSLDIAVYTQNLQFSFVVVRHRALPVLAPQRVTN